MIPILIRNYTASAAIRENAIVMIGGNDNEVIPATSSADDILGVSTNIPSAAGARCDVIHVGIADVRLGGTVGRGRYVTAGAGGTGVSASTGRIVGVALTDGVEGDIIPVLLGIGQA